MGVAQPGDGFRFGKGFEWEVIEFPSSCPRIVSPTASASIKWLDLDEFTNWSNRDSTAAG